MVEKVSASVLGDSHARRLSEQWLRVSDTIQLHTSAAVGGWTSTQLEHCVKSIVTELPTTCFIIIGTNDILKSIPYHRTKFNVKSIINTLKINSKKMFISTLPPTLINENSVQKQFRRINIFFQSMHNPPQVTVINFHKHFAPFANKHFKLYHVQNKSQSRTDKVHLSIESYQRWAADVNNCLVRQTGRPHPAPSRSTTLEHLHSHHWPSPTADCNNAAPFSPHPADSSPACDVVRVCLQYSVGY